MHGENLMTQLNRDAILQTDLTSIFLEILYIYAKCFNLKLLSFTLIAISKRSVIVIAKKLKMGQKMSPLKG